MLILIPNGVAFVVGDVPVDAGDIGRFIKSSFCSIKPLLVVTGDLSSSMGDFSSCDDGDDKSDDGFLRQTSRWRSIEPGKVRGGTRFCGNGPG
jgi:hypothetical protein